MSSLRNLVVPAIVVLLGCTRAMRADPAPDAKPTPIIKARQPITIDGVLDEPVWQQAEPIDVDYIWGKVGQRSAEPRMRVRYAWDEHYLYLGYETFDRNLVALGTGEKEGPPGNQREGCVIRQIPDKADVVEFFISFGDLRFFWEVHQNAANQFNDVWCVVVDEAWPIRDSTMNRFGIQFHSREFIQDDDLAGCTLAKAVRLKPKADGKPSTINDPSDVDTGYTGEMRLPWLGLGAPLRRETFVPVEPPDPKFPRRQRHGPWKMAGQPLHILAVVQDGDLDPFYHHSSPTKRGGWFHQGAEHWPRYRLEE